ncbi:MAG: hypothetical protein OXG78_01070 [Chloroflexi bacterium]|nr:hypothetical protein [Chloroflexota bacterium]
MSLREFLTAIPKVELNLQLTGALQRESLVMIAKQNGVPSMREDFEEWVALFDRPDYARIDAIARETGSWAMYPEDIALMVYDIGVALFKQNVVYAEIVVAPPDFVGSAHMNFDTFVAALNDGRDRALRGWNVDMAWILCIPRDNPRSGDEVSRWATSPEARSANVVALGLTGPEDAQPIGQFRRAFDTAHKKEINTVVSTGSDSGGSSVHETMEELSPQRLTDAWGIVKDDAMLKLLAENGTALCLSLSRAQRLGLVKKAGDYPLRQLIDRDVNVALSTGMPILYQSTLIDEYIMAHEECALGIDELIQLSRRSIELSYMDAESKEALLRRFDFEMKAARAKWL